jgi:hypothetical protein
MSTLFDALGKQQVQQTTSPPPANNMTEFFNRFNEFKRTFTGDPKAKVMELLTNGQMTKEQFEQLKQMAQQLQNGFKH